MGDSILDLQDHWSQYRPFASEMVVLALVNSTQVVLTCFATFETARGHFRFFWYSLSIPIAKTAVLYLLTGYTFFEGRLPVSWMDAIGHFNPNRLSFILNCFLAANLLQIVSSTTDYIQSVLFAFSFVAFSVGLSVFILVISLTVAENKKEARLLYLLGISRKDVARLYGWSGFQSAGSALLGSCLGLLAAAVLTLTTTVEGIF